MGEGEPKFCRKPATKMEIAVHKAELEKLGFSPNEENVDTIIALKQTKQRPLKIQIQTGEKFREETFEEIYNNLDKPEILQKEMEKKGYTR